MRHPAVLVLLAWTPWFSPIAAAEPVTCESRDQQRQECHIDTRGDVRLVARLSQAKCEEGRSWGVDHGRVWVDRGCRAVFESYGDDIQSPAVHNEAFPSGLPRHVTCESRNQQRTDCAMDTRGEVRLKRRLSHADCEAGISWGLFRSSVWVDRGCRAVFEARGTDYDYRPNKLPGWAVRACNSVEYDHGRVIDWRNPRPGAYEITLEDAKGRFECAVVSGGKVTDYERVAVEAALTNGDESRP